MKKPIAHIAASAALLLCPPLYAQFTGVALEGHLSRNVYEAAFSPKGGEVMTACNDSYVRFFNPTTGEQIDAIYNEDIQVFTAAYSPSGDTMATGDRATNVRLWSRATGIVLKEFSGHIDNVNRVLFAPNGQTVISVGSDGRLAFWRLNGASHDSTIVEDAHNGKINDAAIDPSGNAVITAGDDGSVALWAIATGSLIRRIENAHEGEPVNGVAISPDGSLVATAGTDGVIKVWNAITAEAVRSISASNLPVRAVAFSPTGSWIASGGDDAMGSIWSTQSGNKVTTLQSDILTNVVNSIRFGSDSTQIVTAANDRRGVVWTIEIDTHTDDEPVAASPTGDRVRLWPNPAATTAFVDAMNAREVSVFDALGRTVFSMSRPNPELAIDVSAWTPGTYSVVVQTSSGTRSGMLTISR